MISYDEMDYLVNSMKDDNENEVSILADDAEDYARISDYMFKRITHRNVEAQVDIYVKDTPEPHNMLRIVYMKKQF